MKTTTNHAIAVEQVLCVISSVGSETAAIQSKEQAYNSPASDTSQAMDTLALERECNKLEAKIVYLKLKEQRPDWSAASC